MHDRLPAAANRIVIAYNQRAGRAAGHDAVSRLVAELARRGYHSEVFDDRDAAAARAQSLFDDGRQLRALVAAGGDGTVADMVNRVAPGMPIAMLPLGTENLLAKHFGLLGGPAVVAEAIHQGWVARLDAGLANGRTFLLMMSAGLDADIIRRLAESRTGNINHASYFGPIVDACREYGYPPLRITWDVSFNDSHAMRGKSLSSSPRPPYWARWVQAINVPRYALGLHFVSEASPTDGLAHVCAFRGNGFWPTLGHYLSVLLRRHRRWTDCRVWTARRIRIEADVPTPYQLDGDPGGWLPVDVEIVRRRFAFIVPRGKQATPWPRSCSIPADRHRDR